jgi:hypothetical protein
MLLKIMDVRLPPTIIVGQCNDTAPNGRIIGAGAARTADTFGKRSKLTETMILKCGCP